MRVILCAVGIVVLMIGSIHAELKEGPWPTDPELAKVEREMDEEEQQCKAIKNFMKRSRCYDKVWNAFASKGIIRGTQEYVDLHYADLPTPALLAKSQELQDFLEKARTKGMAETDREPGELSKETLLTEINSIEIELRRRDLGQHQDNLKFYKGLQNNK